MWKVPTNSEGEDENLRKDRDYSNINRLPLGLKSAVCQTPWIEEQMISCGRS